MNKNYIIIGGDFVAGVRNQEQFCAGDADALVGSKLAGILKNADRCIFNLETPLTDREDPIPKNGPNLIAPAAAAAGYKAIGADILSLANNHILDQGEQGLAETRAALEKQEIACFGAGKTPQEAARPYIFSWRDKKIGLYACAEHEFSIVDELRAGANPFDPLESPDHIAALKHECDYVIVLYHGGKEHYRYPSPKLQKSCRKMIEKGADLVLCQHTHCVGCEEKYCGGTIVYGQGNFLFDGHDNEYWRTGLLIQIEDGFKIRYIPLVKQGNGVRLAEGEEAARILNGFHARSEEIKTEGAIERHYLEFAGEQLPAYARTLLWHEGFLFKAVNKMLGKNRLRRYKLQKTDKKDLTAIQNYIECEAHRELFLAGIEDLMEHNQS